MDLYMFESQKNYEHYFPKYNLEVNISIMFIK